MDSPPNIARQERCLWWFVVFKTGWLPHWLSTYRNEAKALLKNNSNHFILAILRDILV